MVINELEHEGVISKKQGMGCFIAPTKENLKDKKERKSAALKAAHQFLIEIWPLNLTKKEILEVLKESEFHLKTKWRT